MTIVQAPPIACTLAAGEYKNRLAWIAELARDALRRHERHDLVLDLRYAPEARDRVREMVRNERTCCAFLAFDLREGTDEVQLTITAPETAREAVDVLFEEFVAAALRANTGVIETAAAPSLPSSHPAKVQPGAKAAGVTAVTLACGAVACGAACVPAALAGMGGVLALLGDGHRWLTGLAILAVAGAWGWIGWQTFRMRCRPAASSLWLTIVATGLAVVALLWPLIEPQLVHMLMV